jgi:hypothetical protein
LRCYCALWSLREEKNEIFFHIYLTTNSTSVGLSLKITLRYA